MGRPRAAMRQRITYCRPELKAPAALLHAVHHQPAPAAVETFLIRQPDLVWADDLFLSACRVPGYSGKGGAIVEELKHQAERCEVVKLFVEYGADPSLRNKRKVSPLHVACCFDLGRVAKRLLELGADADAYDAVRETPLLHAVNLGYPGCVSVLLAAGADQDFTNRKGQTPLHRAVIRGRQQIVPLLLAAGCDRTLRDKSDKTPVDYSRSEAITAALQRPPRLGG